MGEKTTVLCLLGKVWSGPDPHGHTSHPRLLQFQSLAYSLCAGIGS